MNTKLTIRSIYAAILVGWAGASGALSLGPVSGTTVVGRPLELSAPIQLDEAGVPDCVQAELLYGDKPVDGSSVTVHLASDASRQGSVARITSSSVVDEPVVTVLLKVGCGRQSMRRYVVLAEPPKDEPVLLAAASSVATLTPVAAGTSKAVAPPRRSAAAPVSSRAATVAATRAPKERAVAVAKHDTQSPRAGRLQLALWDPNAPEGVPWLRTSTQLLSSPTADTAQRAAAIALWRALNAQPQDLLRTAERLRGLEGEMASLRGLAGRHRSEIMSTRESLQAARSQGYANLALVMALAVVAGASAAFLWHRSRHAANVAPYASWYPMEPEGEYVVDDAPESAPVAARPAVAPVVLPAALKPVAKPVVQPSGDPKPAPLAEPRKQDEVAPLLSAFEFTLPDAVAPKAAADDKELPVLKVDALHGAQQQSEFFVSLGQYDEAIAVLTEYLRECKEKPVLAFLELFRIYHGLGMRQEFDDLRATFQQTYGVEAALFDDYREDRRELELFPVAVSRISASWPSQAALDVIEGMLFKPPASPREFLSLEASRELIWLYTLGQDIVGSTGMPAGLQLLGDTSLPNDHFILPWAVSSDQGPPELSLERLNAIDVAPGLSGFGVDIDLTAVSGGAQHDAVKEKQEPKDLQSRADDDASAFDSVMEAQSRRH